jgi:hypothetical protein
MKPLVAVLCVAAILALVDGCHRRAYDYKPFPLIEEVIEKCNLKSIIEWECYWNVKERLVCHSCVLEHIRCRILAT